MREAHDFAPKISYSRPDHPVKQPPLQERVRARLRALVETGNVSHEILGKYLGLSRSAVTRLLNDESNGIGFQHLEKLCEFFQVTPCELMNGPHSLIQEVKPLEAQLLHLFRDMSELQRHSLLAVLTRESRPAKPRRARAGHAPLTEAQQLLVDLFADSDEEARKGVMTILRGAAAHAKKARLMRDGTN